MNALINNILLAATLFIVTFSIASSFLYPTTKAAVVPTQTTTPQLLMLTQSISEPITFSVPSIPVPKEITVLNDHIEEPLPTQLLEEPLVQFPISVNERVEISLPTPLTELTEEVQPTETLPLFTELIENPTVEPTTETIPLPTQVQEITEAEVVDNLQDVVGVATQGVTIINNLNKRLSLKLFTPLGIKRKVNKVEKNLATTKAEILTLYKENPTVVTAILKTHLPELFV